MMMGNPPTTSTFMTQRPGAASSFIYVKTNRWVEYNAGEGIVFSLQDVQANVDQEIMHSELRCTIGDSRILYLFVTTLPCRTEVVLHGFLFGGFDQMCTQCAHSAPTWPEYFT